MTFSDAKDQPKRLGDFEIIRELGRGGMGVVYEARQRSLNRHVALKVLSTGLGLTSKAVMRFKREAEAAAKLHHRGQMCLHPPDLWRGLLRCRRALPRGSMLYPGLRGQRVWSRWLWGKLWGL